MLYNDQFPFAHANIDRIVIGEKAGLECKTTSVLNLSNFMEEIILTTIMFSVCIILRLRN